jgi:UDP-glucuronate decarboxylase
MRRLKSNEPLDTFLTGGTGFFGCSILREQIRNSKVNIDLTVLSRDPDRFSKFNPELAGGAHWIKGDIMNLELSGVQGRFKAVLHAAADSTSTAHLSYLQRYDQIVEGTQRMLDFAVSCGARRFLLTSTGGVYGRQSASMPAIPEDYCGIPDPLDAKNVYSLAKRAAEHLCALYAEEHGLEVVIARCFAFVGEDLPLNVHYAIGNFIRDALWSDEIIVNGDGTPMRSYLDQRDLAHWLITLLRDGKAGEAYNVGSDREISITDLAHLVRDLVSPEKPVRILGKPVDNAERSRYVPDISKIHRHLGLRPTYSLEQSILNTAAAVRARGRPNEG